MDLSYPDIKRMMQMEVSKYERVGIRERELIVQEKHICMEENKLAVLASIPDKDRMEAIRLMYTPTPPALSDESDKSEKWTATENPLTTSNFRTDSTGPIVRIYMPDDLSTHINQYDGLTTTLREEEDVSYSAIKTAATECTIYSGRRWQLVPRDKENEHVPMLETVTHQVRRTGFVAVMADDGASIVDVFANMARFAEFAKVTASAVTLALQNNTKTGKKGGVKMSIKMWDEQDKAMQDEWLIDHDLPTRQASSKCKPVYRTCVAD
jgi:hypothetical protein